MEENKQQEEQSPRNQWRQRKVSEGFKFMSLCVPEPMVHDLKKFIRTWKLSHPDYWDNGKY